jgi:hypothetical protein
MYFMRYNVPAGHGFGLRKQLCSGLSVHITIKIWVILIFKNSLILSAMEKGD